MTRKSVLGTRKFGWCTGQENEQQHEACPVSYVTTHTTATHTAGDIVKCQCQCHGDK